MKSIAIRLLTAAVVSLPSVALGQSNPVVVELFTSQGCSSCPPADDYLAGLVGRDDVIPLAFHVDYWDRLGWTDTFASKQFTERQYSYGSAFQNRSVWTPQFVVGGVAYSRGSFRKEVANQIKKIGAAPVQITLSATLQDGNVAILAEPLAGGLPDMLVSLVGYSPEETVQIKRGENAGRTISYHNTVTSWTDVAKWNGRNSTSLTVAAPSSAQMAVIVQAQGFGPIIAAAHVK